MKWSARDSGSLPEKEREKRKQHGRKKNTHLKTVLNICKLPKTLTLKLAITVCREILHHHKCYTVAVNI